MARKRPTLGDLRVLEKRLDDEQELRLSFEWRYREACKLNLAMHTRLEVIAAIFRDTFSENMRRALGAYAEQGSREHDPRVLRPDPFRQWAVQVIPENVLAAHIKALEKSRFDASDLEVTYDED